MDHPASALASRRVEEIVERNFVALSVHQTMAEAAAALLEHGQSSAPVVDEKGHCVGILTSEHFLRYERALEGEAPRSSDDEAPSLLRPQEAGPFHIDECRTDLVRSHMLPSVQSVAPNETLDDVARIMVAAQLHRLPVLDASAHPVGMVTALAVLGALTAKCEVMARDSTTNLETVTLPASPTN